MRKIVLSILSAVLVSLPGWTQTVKLGASTSPGSGQAGVTSVSVTGSGFPSGTINAASITVTLTPTAGSAVTTAASTIGTIAGSTKVVGFLIPSSIAVTSPTTFAVTVSGQTTVGTKFQSSNSASLIVNPPPAIASISPTNGQQGQTVSVTINGQYTNFAVGATKANFGPGISVGGAAAGTNGPVSVTNATTAIASIAINTSAGAGPRSVTVITAPFSSTLNNAFTVNPASPPTAVPGGPYSEHLPTALQVDGSGSSDPNSGATLSYDWNWGDGSADGTGVSPSHTYASAGTYHGSLTVKDNYNLTSSPVAFTVTVTANPTAKPGGPYNEQLPGAVSFDGSGSSTPNAGATLTYDWSWGDNTPDGTGAKPAHTYASAGTYNGTLTVTDSLGYASAPVGFAVNVTASGPPPVVTITAPDPLSVFNASGNPVTVKGTVDKNSDTVTVNGVAASVSGGVFTATGVQLREGANVLTATATDTFGNVGSASETVTLNTTPPQLGILSPSDGAVVMTSTITVAGNVNEQVPGTINAKQVTIMVNGIAAAVSNRTFSAPNVPLVQGMNTIMATATDPAGNTSQNIIHVTYMGSIPVQKLLKISGDGQSGAVGTTLSQPLVIEAVDSNGAPVPSQQVTFAVIKSDGLLTSTTQQGQQVTAVTDQNGLASVQFQLGTRVGVGNNQVSVSASGFLGEAVFTATSTVGAPSKIVAEMGDNQIGIAGQALPAPLVIEVFDAGGNPVPYVPVTFTILNGGGSFAGNTTLQVSTDINGMASALLTLGQQEGINNNNVSATFTGNPGPAASFIASGQALGPASITSISGLVEDDSNTPVAGATITLEGTSYTATSDQNGNFSISPAPVGTYLLKVDGHTSTRTDAIFPTLVYNITTIAGLNNTLGMPVCLPPLDPTSVQTYDPNSNNPLVLQMTGIPGYVFTVAPHSVFNPDGSPYSGPLSLSQVHADRVPMAPPHGSLPLIAGTLQPPGLHFNPAVATQFPNTSALAPGTVVDVYSYDHDQMDWVSQGPARVSVDGSVITSDPGFGISKSGWHFPPPPPPPPKCASSCTTKNPCESAMCVNGACVTQPANDGATCSDGTAGEECGTNGKCKGGACTFDSTATDGQSCTPEDKCVKDAMCKSGQCVGKPYDTASWHDDPSFTAQVTFPAELTSKLSEFLSTITGGNIELDGLNFSGKGQTKNCCTQESGPHDDGESNASLQGQLVAKVKGLPLAGAPHLYKVITIPFTSIRLGLDMALGIYFGSDIQLNGTVGKVQSACEMKKNCTFAQVDISLEPDIYVQGSVYGCASIYTPLDECIGGNITGGIKVTLSGGGRWHKPECDTPINLFVGGSKPTLHGSAQVQFLGSKYQIGVESELNWWPAWSCSTSGGCQKEP